MSDLIKLLIENKERPASVKFSAVAGAANVYLKGVIAADYGASAADLRAAFDEAGGADVTLHINTPGGDAFEAREMQSVIAGYAGKVVASIEGMAASAGTVVCLSASSVQMLKGSRYMIHNGMSGSWGDKNDLRARAALLDSFDTELAAEYARKTGASVDQVAAWMDAETWFTADQALEAKFVDSLVENTQNVSNAARWNLNAYANAPKDEPPALDYAALHAANRRRLQLLQFA